MELLDKDNLLKNRIAEICDADKNSQWRNYCIESLVMMGEIIEVDEMIIERNVSIG